jgi:allophanate hydrolase
MISGRELAELYGRGVQPSEVLAGMLGAIDENDPVWIARHSARHVLARAAELERRSPAERAALPLFGWPFAVKDNIDVAGLPTTAGCPAFAYLPERSATVVERLEAAGAIAIGKTNLDQFATGLVGTRSPYGIPRNPFDERYIPGGSSSGSAVAVARGLVPFALGTDTAGSGRVPAGFTGTVGLKPTVGILSTAGVVPACRSLDCVSIFARTLDDAAAVLDVAAALDPRDPFSRQRERRNTSLPNQFAIAVPLPEQRMFCGDEHAQQAYARALARLTALGGTPVEVDFAPCFAAAALLYEGPFVAERTAAVGEFARRHPEALLEITRTIIESGRRYSAVDVFDAQYRLRALRRETERIFERAPVLAVPTSPTIYTLEQIAAEPLALNTTLGTYTNFVNLLDLCALAVPSERYPGGLPIGVTFVAPAFADGLLLDLARRYEA